MNRAEQLRRRRALENPVEGIIKDVRREVDTYAATFDVDDGTVMVRGREMKLVVREQFSREIDGSAYSYKRYSFIDVVKKSQMESAPPTIDEFGREIKQVYHPEVTIDAFERRTNIRIQGKSSPRYGEAVQAKVMVDDVLTALHDKKHRRNSPQDNQ